MTVVASLFGQKTSELVAMVRELATRRRMVELRLDLMGDEVDLSQVAREAGRLRVLLACVPVDQGGQFAGSEQQWQARVLEACRQLGSVEYLDVPPTFSRPAELPDHVRVVWSWHAPAGEVDFPPCRAALDAALQRAEQGDVIKVVAWADRHRQAMPVLRLYNEIPRGGPRLLAFAQGPGGSASRLFALSLGAPWTYAAWDEMQTAPGQWSESQLPVAQNWSEVRWLGVLGQPVAHSRSPLLWNCALRWHDRAHVDEPGATPTLDSSRTHYLALEHNDLADFAVDYQASCFAGFSVTTPLKEQAAQVATSVDASSERTGAANWLRREADGSWRAASTDGDGALRALHQAGLPNSAPIWVLGAGGAARSVWLAATQHGHPLVVVARRPNVAHQELQRLGLKARVLAWDQLQLPRRDPFALVNATPVGFEDPLADPIASVELAPTAVVLDLVYQPVQTALLSRARRAGCVTVPGHVMLLEQMRLQFADLFHLEPPAGLLRMALEQDLGIAQPSVMLVGPRASGKSTLGRMLAEVLAWPFLDADSELERRAGRPITSWVRDDLPGFRAAEAALLDDFLDGEAQIVALGGGIVETEPACARLAAHPRVIALQLSCAEQLARRAADQRPALTQLPLDKEIEVLDQKRASLYEKASSRRCVSVEGMTADAFRRLAESLNLYW